MTATAAVRFALATSMGTQRWVAPTATFAAAVLVLYAQGGDIGTTIAMGVVVLFVASAWLAAGSLAHGGGGRPHAITATAWAAPHRARLATVARRRLGQALVSVPRRRRCCWPVGSRPLWLVERSWTRRSSWRASPWGLVAPPVLGRGTGAPAGGWPIVAAVVVADWPEPCGRRTGTHARSRRLETPQ